MPTYYYKASSADGEVQEGEVTVADEEALIQRLHDGNLIPLTIEPAGARRVGRRPLLRSRRMGHEAVGVFTQELATLLNAGLPLDRALSILSDLGEDSPLGRMTARVLEQVQGGASLSDALENQEGVFSRLYVNMVRAGEMGGSLGEVLLRLSDYLERARALRDSVVSALIYPAILVTVSLVSVIVLLVFVVPQFTQLFEDAGTALPLPTQIVITSGDLLRHNWWAVLGGLLLLLLLLRQLLSSARGRAYFDSLVLRLPLFGALVTKLELARFSRTLGTLLDNGVPVLASLSLVKETIGNRVLALEVEAAVDNLKQGRSFTEPLQEGGRFPRLGLQMIKVGEETGELETMLLKVADTYDKEVSNTVARILSLLEPVLIVGLGVLVAGIIVSILMAILSVNELAF